MGSDYESWVADGKEFSRIVYETWWTEGSESGAF